MTGTGRTVRRLWIGLLAAALATLAGATLAIDLGRREANALRTGEAPAREGVAAARQSLWEADTEAVTRFRAAASAAADRSAASADEAAASADRVLAAGPGEAYRTAIAAAGRQLAQVSQADVGGAAAEAVQVVNGLLITYTGLIEQAFRADAAELLAESYLQYAHNLLREEIVSQLDTLDKEISDATSGRAGGARHLLWVVPWLVLAGLLVAAQLLVARRFRRVLSAPLVAASVLALALGLTAALATIADRDVGFGETKLDQLVADYRVRQAATIATGCSDLAAVSADWYRPEGTGCGTPGRVTPDRDMLSAANQVSTAAQRAATTAARAIVVVLVTGLLAGALITLGLWPRIEEYRFRPR